MSLTYRSSTCEEQRKPLDVASSFLFVSLLFFSSFNSEVAPHGLLVVLFTQTSTAVSKGQDVPSAGLLQRLTDLLCAYG